MEMGEFNSDDHYIYYCGQESLRWSAAALVVNRRVWNEMQYLSTISKMTEWSWFISKVNHSISQQSKFMPPTTDAVEAEVDLFYEDLQDLLEVTPKNMSISSYGIGMQK